MGVRCRGGNMKFRALRLDTGNFSWGSEVCTRKTRILDVVYNASNNELVRTKTLVKNAIVQIDATPFRQWYEAHYGVEVSKKKTKKAEKEAAEKAEKGEAKQSKHVMRKIEKRQDTWWSNFEPHTVGQIWNQCTTCISWIHQHESFSVET